MAAVEELITEHIDVWASAVKRKSSAGRAGGKKIELYGVKKLRELILDLAVRGLLVPQDVEDEPASVLLERIAAEKAELVKTKQIKKPKALQGLNEEEITFELPMGWTWAQLGNLIGVMDSGWSPACIPTPSESDNVWGVLKTTAVQIMDYQENENKELPEKLEARPQFEVKPGDILITRAGPKNRVGISCLVESTRPKLMISDKIIRFHLIEVGNSERYISLCLNAGVTASFLEESKSGMADSQMNISQNNLKEAPIAICPIAEQHRIVAKVDELMALCDQLEQQSEASLAAHQTLVQTLLDALTQAASQPNASSSAAAQSSTNSPTPFEQAWHRIAQHFDTLFTTEHSIELLKQNILQLAVMGKLVPQDPLDEPASELLKRIAAEKAKLVAAKKIKKQKALPEIADEEKPFELPDGWIVLRFSDLANEIATGPFGTMVHKKDYIEGGVPLINPSHMINGLIVEETSISVSKVKAHELCTYRLNDGDVVMARRGEMGRCALVTAREENWLCGTGSFVLKFHQKLCRRFILLTFSSKTVKTYLGGKSVGTTMTNLNHGILNKMPFSLPPEAEQHRIVAKVDELMALCDQLKARLADAQSTQLQLADAATEQAIQ